MSSPGFHPTLYLWRQFPIPNTEARVSKIHDDSVRFQQPYKSWSVCLVLEVLNERIERGGVGQLPVWVLLSGEERMSWPASCVGHVTPVQTSCGLSQFHGNGSCGK